MKFEIEVITRKQLEEMVESNALGTRYEYAATLKGEDGKEYVIFADMDYKESIVAVLTEEFDD